LIHLDVSGNNLGQLVVPEGWEVHPEVSTYYRQQGGEWTTATKVPGAQPLGIIAIANAIPDMGAMTSLSLASNGLGVEGAKLIAAVLPT
jgi:hypothetical protein